MQRLKSRQKQIPNGYRFRQPEINWDSVKVIGLHPSFDTLVRAVQSARKANPAHAAKHKWALDTAGVANDVEIYQVKICLTMGYMSYLTDSGGGAPPFNQAQSLLSQKQLGAAVGEIKKLWAGVKTGFEWLDSGQPPVTSEQSEKRAATCVDCHLNGKGDFTKWFTIPVAAAIKRQLQQLEERKLSTSQDAKLQVCEACLCPLKLKVHTPINFIQNHLSAEVMAELRNGKNCWILAEEKAL